MVSDEVGFREGWGKRLAVGLLGVLTKIRCWKRGSSGFCIL